jgi:RecA/RadA recombinase
MALKSKAKLDPLNVAYGVGAAVVITGAMFKFLNFPFASEMLFVGLAVEALVFFISAFELKKDDVDYHWDRIFPQLTKEGENKIERIEDWIEQADLDPMVIQRLTKSIERLEQNVNRMADMSDVAQLNDQVEKMRQSSEMFEQEISKLNTSISQMNLYYMRMLEVMGNKSQA